MLNYSLFFIRLQILDVVAVRNLYKKNLIIAAYLMKAFKIFFIIIFHILRQRYTGKITINNKRRLQLIKKYIENLLESIIFY